ncbi:MAG: GGDEF domain-containing protein [Hahellaceae bacterium]|nr:GGDEF domain-containing protein [Hahellaceae bacterium]MCP5169890.1 GGDEF domain-containing protein [Hahellaceae bacterium]
MNSATMNFISAKQLKPYTRIAIYSMAALTSIILARESYLYGLYDLVYTALILFALYLAGIALSWAQQSLPLRDNLHQYLLIVAALLVLSDLSMTSDAARYGLYPLCLLSFLILPLRQSARFNAILLGAAFILTWYSNGFFTAVAFATSYLLLAGIASLYAWLHHNRSRSLVELSIHDPVTEAYNMRHFEETLDKEIHRADDTSLPLSIIALEVDYLNQFTSLHGQQAGSDLARQLSEMLGGMIRAGDSHYYDNACRFYLLLPNTPQEGVLVIAERIRRRATEHAWHNTDHLTLSLGCSSLTPDTQDVQSLISESQSALSEAQKNGHNRVCHFLR